MANDLRQQASVELEVAKARLVRAREQQDRAAAQMMATEAAFDAGMAQGYANAAEEPFSDPQQILLSIKAFLGEDSQAPAANPTSFQGAMNAAKQANSADCAYYMGHAYVYANSPEKSQEVLQLFDTMFRETPRVTNPRAPVPTNKLKSKLLR